MTEIPIDRRAQFSAFHRMHFPSILAYSLRRCPTRDDACDVTAEVFLVAWRRFDDVPVGPQGRLWLFGVARRALANHRRTDQRQTLLAAKLTRQRIQVPDDASPVDEALTIALSQLRDDDRELLTLIVWDELSPREAATVLGITAATARVRLHRTRTRLRNLIVQLELNKERAGPLSPTFAHQLPSSTEMDL